MPPACKKCPNCWFGQLKKPIQIEEVSTCENECDGQCARDLSGERAIVLPCKHKYCVRCLNIEYKVGLLHVACVTT